MIGAGSGAARSKCSLSSSGTSCKVEPMDVG